MTYSEVDRRQVVDYYLGREVRKGKVRPTSYDTIRWDDVNMADRWFADNGYKTGVITGFRRWVLVTVTSRELGNCAIYLGLVASQGWRSQRLGDLVTANVLCDWRPDTSDRDWCREIAQGLPLGPSQALIARPALRSESGAALYVEDGSGRAAWYGSASASRRLRLLVCRI